MTAFSSRRPPGPHDWPAAAEDLARRVTRRERAGAFLRPFAGRLLPAAAAALAAAWLARGAPALAPAVLAVGGAFAVLAGLAGARRVRVVAPGDAAWALDRIASAGERGLVAALLPGPVGAEAAWSEPRVIPPVVRLRSPEGLARATGAILLGVLALLIAAGPVDADDPRGTGTATPPSHRTPGGGDEGRAPDDLEEAALAGEVVREALGLPESSASDPTAVAERLRDPTRRREAEEAARGTPLEGILSAGAGDAESVAEALAQAREAGEAARRGRRDEAGDRAAGGHLPVPATRRALLERYFSLPGRPGETGSETPR
jgi:hypothetical protein